LRQQIFDLQTFIYFNSYHQKYGLQQHKELVKQLGLTPRLLQSSYVATKLNGYLVGKGGTQQFMDEAESLGLTKEQINYVYRFTKENEQCPLFDKPIPDKNCTLSDDTDNDSIKTEK
jgi:peptide-methionine (S)-S-oxide reductase